jgi:hypothetical protein
MTRGDDKCLMSCWLRFDKGSRAFAKCGRMTFWDNRCPEPKQDYLQNQYTE